MNQQGSKVHEYDLTIARALTWRYAVALSLVAMLSTAAWVSLHLVIAEQKSTAAIVNVSGRQRMLSQRTALYSNLLVITPREERAVVRDKLKSALELMETSHHGLTHGNMEMGLPEAHSDVVHAMYFNGPDALDKQVETYVRTVQILLAANDDALTPDNPELQYITRTAPTTLVKALDRMVYQYQLEGEAAVASLQQAETILWLTTLLLLVLEALLIFHPFARHVKNIISKLQQLTDELKMHRDNLEDMVKKRTEELENQKQELAESEEKFRLISTSAQDAIVIVGADELVIYWNPAAEKIFGYKMEKVMGKNLHALLAPENYRDAAHNGFRNFCKSGSGELIGKTFEIAAMRSSGEIFPIELSISAVMMQGSWHALGIIRDITIRKQTEKQLLEKTQALQNSNADLEQFAYSVSHDMRQPLRAISGHLQLLEMSLQDKLESEDRENLAFALEGSRRMNSMIISLLDYSRIGRKTQAKSWMQSRESLDDALEFLVPAIKQANATVHVSGEWPMIFGSSDELLRLFQNLVGNAIHYHEPDKLPMVEIDSVVEGKIWRVRVKDHGIGIDPRQFDRLFQFFSRLQLRNRFEGTGMGLALCRRIVEHHNGHIWVESEGEGQGSTFVFELPVLSDAEQ